MADFTFLADKAVFCTMLQKLSKCEVKTAQCGFAATHILREIKFLGIQMAQKCHFWQI